jgi:hypothetical protein
MIDLLLILFAWAVIRAVFFLFLIFLPDRILAKGLKTSPAWIRFGHGINLTFVIMVIIVLWEMVFI